MKGQQALFSLSKFCWFILALSIFWLIAPKIVSTEAKDEKRYISLNEYFVYARTHIIAYTGRYIISPQLEEPYIRESKELSPREYLKEIAGDSFELKDRIIFAESGWKVDAKNHSSSASGLAQFLNGTFLRYCVEIYNLAQSLKDKNDPYIQLKCFNKMVDDGGISHWGPSKIYWDI